MRPHHPISSVLRAITPLLGICGASAAEAVAIQGPAPTALTRCAEAPVVDGRLDDACWKTVPVIPIDQPNGRGLPRVAEPPAVVRYAGDDRYLYIGYETFDRNLVAEGNGDVQGPAGNRRDGCSIWLEGKRVDVVEFFISLGDQRFMWELHHNARNQFNDVFCVATDPAWPIHRAATNPFGILFLEREFLLDDGACTVACAAALKAKADGAPSTVGQEDDADSGYCGEIRIPWLALGIEAERRNRAEPGAWKTDGLTVALLAVVQDGDREQRYHRSGPFGRSTWFHLDGAVWPRYVLGSP